MCGAPVAYTRCPTNPQAIGEKVASGRSPQSETAPDQNEHAKDEYTGDGESPYRKSFEAKQLQLQLFRVF